MSPRVLIVSSDEQVLKGAVHTLRTAGFDAAGAATFEEGSRTLGEFTPRLLIADERLGAFNGLHLVLRGRAVSPDMLAIVTSPNKNAALASDARGLNANCMVTPTDATGWLDPVCRLLNVPIQMTA
jgi:DNA-binding response OmpR family regulator